MGLIIWTLLSRRLVVATTTKPLLGHLAPASEVAGGHTIPFLNWHFLLPLRPELDGQDSAWSSLQQLVVATTRSRWLYPMSSPDSYVLYAVLYAGSHPGEKITCLSSFTCYCGMQLLLIMLQSPTSCRWFFLRHPTLFLDCFAGNWSYFICLKAERQDKQHIELLIMV
jgi:hypothetical protein